jgi:hypothetical protein
LKIKSSRTEKEVAFIEKCVVRTMRKFRESPRSFWSEDDICCYLKQLLLKGRAFRSGRLGNVFLAFPTRNTYERRADGTLFASSAGKSECFAVAGWSSTIPSTWSHLTQQLSFAIELEYFTSIPESWAVRVRNHLLKLTDDGNAVPSSGRFFLLLTGQQTSQLRGQLNALLAEFPSVRCYQQLAQ